jgi:hypothetical protein
MLGKTEASLRELRDESDAPPTGEVGTSRGSDVALSLRPAEASATRARPTRLVFVRCASCPARGPAERMRVS